MARFNINRHSPGRVLPLVANVQTARPAPPNDPLNIVALSSAPLGSASPHEGWKAKEKRGNAHGCRANSQGVHDLHGTTLRAAGDTGMGKRVLRRDRAMFSDSVENTEVASGVSVRATTLKAAHGLPDRAVKDPAG